MAVFELRRYQTHPHNHEKLHERFRAHTVPIFDRLGLPHVGFWQVTTGSGEGDLVYLMRWNSLEERSIGWSTFAADAEWRAVRRSTNNEHGQLVAQVHSQLLTATDYSAMR
jgi:hypothetical protein